MTDQESTPPAEDTSAELPPDTENQAEGASEADAAVATAAPADRLGVLEQEGEIAADYLEVLLDILDLDGDLELDVENDRASVAIVGESLDNLVGSRGTVLEALQDLTRLAVLQKTGERSRLMLDVGGYRAQRRKTLAELAQRTAEEVRDSGEPKRMTPMSPFERKVVHDTVATIEGVVSESEGEDPERRVVVRRA